MLVKTSGELGEGVTAKDLALGFIGQIGTDRATGHVIEYAGPAVRSLSMEGRMTLCNMTIEAGGRAGMVAPDEVTFAYLEGRRFAPRDAAGHDAGDVRARHRARPRAGRLGRRARARLHGPRARHAHRGRPRRPRLHRVV